MQEQFEALWEKFKNIHQRQRLHHAILLNGEGREGDIENLIFKLAALRLCLQQEACGICRSCSLLQKKQHPDFIYLTPEKAEGSILVEQIRSLQDFAYTSAQIAQFKVVCIHPINKMNKAAANALLKILEEPAAHLSFILLTPDLNNVLPTIFSRCQHWRLPLPQPVENYLLWGKVYEPGHPRAKLCASLDLFLQDLQALNAAQMFPCTFAAKWLTHALADLVWILYLITAQMIQCRFQHLQIRNAEAETQFLIDLSQKYPLMQLFKQIQAINEITKKINHNISINQRLIFEHLLCFYMTHDTTINRVEDKS